MGRMAEAAPDTTVGTEATDAKIWVEQVPADGSPKAAEQTALEQADVKKVLGNEAFKAKKHSEAAALYTEAINIAGDVAPAVYFSNRAICRNALGQYEDAIEDGRIALSKPDGITKKTVFNKAKTELKLKRTADAAATLALVREQDSKLAQEVENLLKAEGLAVPPPAKAARSGDKESEASASTPAASSKPTTQASSDTAPADAGDEAARYKEAGNTKYKAAAYKEALVEYEKALACLAKDDVVRRVPLLGNVAAAQLMLRRISDCMRTCEEALGLDASSAKIRARLANAQMARGDFNLARATLKEAPGAGKDDPTITKALVQIDENEKSLEAADGYLKAKLIPKALSALAELEEKALFDCPALTLRMGRCYLELKKFTRVLTTTQQVLRANPQNIDALVLRAEALYRNNTLLVDDLKWPEAFEQGQKLLREALSFDPDHGEAKDFRKRLKNLCTKHAQLREIIGNREFDEARQLVDTMIEDCADNAIVLARLYCEGAKINVRKKDWKQVLKDVGQATYRDHELVQPYLYRAQAMQNLDRHEDAVKGLEDLFNWHRTEEVYNKLNDAKFALRKSKRTDYYELMKVGYLASQPEIKKAYKERASEWHPDKKSHLDEEARKNAEAMFKRIGEAYEVLTNPEKKDLYDKGYDLEGIEEQIEMKKRRGHGHGHGHYH